MLKLMYITNDPKIAVIAENAGVDRIFVDMEYIGKSDRQGGMDTVQCFHTFIVQQILKDSLKSLMEGLLFFLCWKVKMILIMLMTY